MPNPDILIRTGGHKRLSNFMLWQLAYTEIYFVDKLWPDFSGKDFENASSRRARNRDEWFTSTCLMNTKIGGGACRGSRRLGVLQSIGTVGEGTTNGDQHSLSSRGH